MANETTLGKRIKRARERLAPKVSQGALGETLGVTDKAVSAWERDIDRPDPRKLPALRRALRVSYWWLLEGSGQPPEADSAEVLLDDMASAPKELRSTTAKVAIIGRRSSR